jgi:hypothetical protein
VRLENEWSLLNYYNAFHHSQNASVELLFSHHGTFAKHVFRLKQAWRFACCVRVLLFSIIRSLYRSPRMTDNVINDTSTSLFNNQRYQRSLFPECPPFDTVAIIS